MARTAVYLLAGLTLLCGSALAQNLRALPAYVPQQKIAGVAIIRSWGEPQMQSLMTSWEAAFHASQPAVQFSNTLLGTETAQAALFTHVADLALMGREILMLERHVMFRREHHLPLEIMVASGSYDVSAKSNALAIFVNRQNPITQLTLAQLDGIFGDARTGAWDQQFLWHPEYGRSAGLNLRTWGQLGAPEPWAAQPLHVYGYPVTIYSPRSGPMMSFRKIAMQGGDMWNPALQEYEDSAHIAAAMQADLYAIGYGCICDLKPSMKVIAIAPAAGAPFIALTRDSVASRSYPLTRSVYIYIDRSPGEPLDPKVKEFLRFVLSREGQQAVARDGGYLPLTPDLVAQQLRKLE